MVIFEIGSASTFLFSQLNMVMVSYLHLDRLQQDFISFGTGSSTVAQKKPSHCRRQSSGSRAFKQSEVGPKERLVRQQQVLLKRRPELGCGAGDRRVVVSGQ